MNQRIFELAKQADLIQWDTLINKKFADLLFDEFCDVIIDCDENPKLILHEPYNTIIAKLTDHFYGDKE
jgi:hypothetical protein